MDKFVSGLTLIKPRGHGQTPVLTSTWRAAAPRPQTGTQLALMQGYGQHGAVLHMQHEFMTMVQQLSHYLRSHANACDTAEGIARWWLPQAGAGAAPLPVVEAALDWLVERGAVEPIPAADGRVRYRRAAGAHVGALLDSLGGSLH